MLWASARSRRLTATGNHDTVPYPFWFLDHFVPSPLLRTILACAQTNRTDPPTYPKATDSCCRPTAKEKALWRWPARENESNFIDLMDRGATYTLYGVMPLIVQ